MALTKTPIELSSTPGIVDNSNATAITIDSSENVLVGKTATAFGTAGIALRGTVADFTRDGGTPINVNRLTDDGSLIELHKNSAAVGSIGTTTSAGGTRFAIGAVGDPGIIFAGTGVFPATQITASDNSADLGSGTYRWKDIYLSGGAFLGGTGAANKLEDYEEGTHNTTVSFSNSGSATLISNTLAYTKIGNAVTVTGYVGFNGISSPNGILRFTLPFPVASEVHHRSSADLKFNGLNTGYNLNDTPWAIVENNTSTVAVYGGQSNSVNFVMGAACTASTDFRVSVCYITSA